MELEGGRHRDTTQVKGLSPEIVHRVGGRCCSFSSRHNSYHRNWQGDKNPTGSETVCAPRNVLNSASESLAYSNPNQKGRTESCIEAGNCQMKRRQGRYGLQLK
jgi:hypothetical protein